MVTLRPAAEPVPALKYRLVPEHFKLVPGNAAIFYHRAVLIVEERFSSLRAREKEQPGTFPDSLDLLGSATWLNCPIGEIPRERARKYLEPFQNALKEAELGALRSTCDWEFDNRPGEGTDLQLPEIQGIRAIGRLIQLKARLAILDGKTDEAMHWLETGFVIGRHVSQGPLWIQALIGVAISRTMTAHFEDLIQAPGVPSLYWALADRPRPFVDMRRSMEGERYLLEKELPELNELDRGVWGLDRTRQFADTLQRKLFDLASGREIPGTYVALPIGLPDLSRRLGIALMAARIYPEARRALIAQGRPEALVEAMPVIQVAALHSLEEYRRIRDGSYKWTHVPYWQSYNQIDRAILSAGDQNARQSTRQLCS